MLRFVLVLVMCSSGWVWAEEQTLVFGNNAEPQTLDPALMTAIPSHTLALALFEGLTTLDPVTLEPRAGMAERWEMSKDGCTYTFHLRENSWWCDPGGERLEPVTATDFVYSWRRVVNPSTASKYASHLYPVKGAQALATGKMKDLTTLGVSAPDAQTLVVAITAPCAWFLDLCAFPTLMPVHRPTIEKFEALALEKKDPEVALTWAREGNLVSNGSYRLVEWRQRLRIRMKKNPHYWNAGAAKLEEITALPLDAEAAYNRFLDGACDWTRSVPLTKLDEVKLHPDYHVSPVLGTDFYAFNTSKPPFDDVRVRQALSLAISKRDLCRDVLKAGEQPATGFVPPGLPGYRPLQGLESDPRKARRLLREAGYRTPGRDEGDPFPTLELLYNTSERHKQTAETVARMWEETLGITVSLRNTELKVTLERRRNLQFDVIRRSWYGDYTDPNTFLDLFVTGGGNNCTGWSHPRYDELIGKASRELDPEVRFGYLREAETILCREELPILPLYFNVNKAMVAEYVIGIEPNVRNWHPFQHIHIDEAIRAELREE